jgi:xylose isomerase
MDSPFMLPQHIWPERYNHDLDALSFGIWNMNEGGGRFFKANRKWISTRAKLDTLAELGIEYVESHDTDMLDLVLDEDEVANLVGYPEGTSESDKMDLMLRAAHKLRLELDQREQRCAVFTMNLFNSERAWNFGNYGSELDDVRRLAIERTLSGIDVAINVLDAQVYVYWVGTNGTDGLFSAFHPKRIRRTREALVEIMDRALTEHGDAMLPFAIEPKIEEPKFKMYMGTASSSLATIYRIALDHPDLARHLGLNIEVAHSLMGKTDPAMDFGEALEADKLFHVHENGQGEPAYDRDLASGDESLYALVDRMWQLKKAGYRGLIGADVQPLPQDRDNQAAATIERTIRRVRWAAAQARSLDDATMERLHMHHDQAGVLKYVDETVFGIT